MREACGKRRAVIDNKLLCPITPGYGFFEYIVLLPELEYLFLKFGEVYFCIYRFIHVLPLM
jgi:hypothetical protein